MNPYETDKLLNEYLLFHYGGPGEILPWPDGPHDALDYAVRCVTECLDIKSLPPSARALDVGCAVGRSSLELARHCKEVVAVDFSARFIDAAKVLQCGGSLSYSRADEGDRFTTLTARIPDGIDAGRIQFECGDACALRPDIGTFDVVFAANLVDRLPAPERFLAALPGLVRPGGQLILTSPYTWLAEFTPREKWIGGSEGQSTLDGLTSALEPAFSLRETKDLPFLIREHARKYQWSVAQASIWRACTMSDWEELYTKGETPWEKGTPHPELIAFLRRLPLRGRVLVPGCGFGHDVRAIAAAADEVVGLDIAPSAIAGAKKHPLVGGERYQLADLFALPAAMHGSFDWVFEHTCFCAIPPARRDDYVAAVAGALAPGGRILAIFYMNPDMDPGEEGPPFGSSKEELEERFGRSFNTIAEWVPTSTHPGRDSRELCRILERL